MQFALKRNAGQQERELLLQGGAGGGGTSSTAPNDRNKSKETEATATLDTRGLLQLQSQVMKQQDQELEHMEKAIANTKVVAVTARSSFGCLPLPPNDP